MTNARPQKETGAVLNMPGGHAHGTASRRQNQPDAGCKTLHVEIGPKRTSWCRGGRVRELLARAAVPTVFDRARRAWAVPTNRVDDVLVVAEHTERRFVTVEEVAS
ncbi:hypothetical protein SAMN05661080_04797 [Modestobacter sp. DSM 44400]|uniref:hypothetical protein n=1 Tax=Modestobacter sp. DSM 44400 TaxID=1550230 RepID=UPI00089C38FD|nr:hypothetical protein [Modestobacter sp. DSM 44400]SDY84809.1 hypothetical protein SAMN05661080_04797 [Modestobacter sp. DSM 44400]